MIQDTPVTDTLRVIGTLLVHHQHHYLTTTYYFTDHMRRPHGRNMPPMGLLTVGFVLLRNRPAYFPVP